MPILGMALGVAIVLLAGLTIDVLWQALIPAALYLGLQVIEGETVTPMLLAKRFTLNPVLVILSLVFWFWMWGIPGQSSPCPCWRLPRSSATAFAHWLHLAIFSKGEL